jgi:MFS family permease
MTNKAGFSPAHNRWWRILVVALLMYVVSMIDRTNIAMAIPAMRAELGISPAEIGFASGTFFFGYVVLQIPAGRLAAVWSAKYVIFWLMILWGLVSASTALVHTVPELVANRFLLGTVEGGVLTATIVLIRNWFTREERARANTVFLLSLPLGSVIANPLSGIVLQHFNWHVMFVLEAVPALLGAAFVGEHASDLIGEMVLALEMGATLEDLADVIHPHPTFSEAWGEAALAGLGRPLHTLRQEGSR